MTVPGRLIEAVARRPLLRRLVRPVLAFGAVVAAGVLGFVALTGIGPVNAAFWLLDPTSIELYFEHHDGPARVVKAYAIAVLSGLVVTGIWTGETLFSAAFGGQLTDELTAMTIDRRIDEQESHVIVCGYGTFGRTVAEGLRADDREPVIVEQQPELYERAVDDGFLAVEGDARTDETLRTAGVERAETVVGAVDDTSTNVQVAVAATERAPDVRLVVRAGDEMDEALARRVGADDVIVPEVVSGQQVCQGL
ncbi:hypothetical protein GCM10028857_00720 [Salinarchaeum chitinilyticum]